MGAVASVLGAVTSVGRRAETVEDLGAETGVETAIGQVAETVIGQGAETVLDRGTEKVVRRGVETVLGRETETVLGRRAETVMSIALALALVAALLKPAQLGPTDQSIVTILTETVKSVKNARADTVLSVQMTPNCARCFRAILRWASAVLPDALRVASSVFLPNFDSSCACGSCLVSRCMYLFSSARGYDDGLLRQYHFETTTNPVRKAP
jgi:hypothetical protein